MSHFVNRITPIHVSWQLYLSGVSPELIPEKVGRHRATIYRWISGIKKKGLNQFLADYENAKKGRRNRKINPLLKARVYKIREEKYQCCGEKIRYFLAREYSQIISTSTIYRVLNEKYQLRSKWKKNQVRGDVFKGTKSREYIQVDTVFFGDVVAYTAIDTFTKEPRVILKSGTHAYMGAEALKEQMKYYGRVVGLQRDGGPEFGKEWEEEAKKHCDRIRTARPYKKNEQAFIERFNGVLRKECLGYGKYRKEDIPRLQKKVDEYLDYYLNERPHLSLNMLTPKLFTMSHLT
jgi:transposase InsO family protein